MALGPIPQFLRTALVAMGLFAGSLLADNVLGSYPVQKTQLIPNITTGSATECRTCGG